MFFIDLCPSDAAAGSHLVEMATASEMMFVARAAWLMTVSSTSPLPRRSYDHRLHGSIHGCLPLRYYVAIRSRPRDCDVLCSSVRETTDYLVTPAAHRDSIHFRYWSSPAKHTDRFVFMAEYHRIRSSLADDGTLDHHGSTSRCSEAFSHHIRT